MKNKIIDKINSEAEILQTMMDHMKILKQETARLQTQIERKNGSILSLKELLEEVEAEELEEQAFIDSLEKTPADSCESD